VGVACLQKEFFATCRGLMGANGTFATTNRAEKRAIAFWEPAVRLTSYADAAEAKTAVGGLSQAESTLEPIDGLR